MVFNSGFKGLNWLDFEGVSEGAVAGKAPGLRAEYSIKEDAAEFISKYQSFAPFFLTYVRGETHTTASYI